MRRNPKMIIAEKVYNMRDFIVAAFASSMAFDDVIFQAWLESEGLEYKDSIEKFHLSYLQVLRHCNAENAFHDTMTKSYGLSRADSGIPESNLSESIKKRKAKTRIKLDKMAENSILTFLTEPEHKEILRFLSKQLKNIEEAANSYQAHLSSKSETTSTEEEPQLTRQPTLFYPKKSTQTLSLGKRKREQQVEKTEKTDETTPKKQKKGKLTSQQFRQFVLERGQKKKAKTLQSLKTKNDTQDTQPETTDAEKLENMDVVQKTGSPQL